MHAFRMISIISTVLMVAPVSSAQQAPLSEQRACTRLMKRMGTHDGEAPENLRQTWFCDVTTTNYDHPDWIVIGLRSFRECDGFCSNLRGWFAVNRKTGEVREWNVGDWTIGDPIREP